MADTTKQIDALRADAEKLRAWREVEYELLGAEPFDAGEVRSRIGRRIYYIGRQLAELEKEEQRILKEGRQLNRTWETAP